MQGRVGVRGDKAEVVVVRVVVLLRSCVREEEVEVLEVLSELEGVESTEERGRWLGV